jgi:hypothetical protein
VAAALKLVIRRQTWIRSYLSAMQRALPKSLQGWFRGPVATLWLDGAAPFARLGYLRPFDLVLGDDVVLKRRLSLPRMARADLPHAVELFIREETPFEPREVLIEAEERPAAPGDEQLTYLLRMLPVAQLEQGLRRLRLRRGRVRKVLLEDGSGQLSETQFARALLPHRRVKAWLTVIPIVIFATAMISAASQDLRSRQNQLSELEMEVETATATGKTLNAELDVREKATAGEEAAIALIVSTPSAFAMLEAIRHLLPNPTEVTRLELHSGELRIAVLSSNVLVDAQSLSRSSLHWSGAVEGAITADPQGKGELATILFRNAPAGSN